MSFNLSPGVTLREIDLSQTVSNFTTSSAAIVGYSSQGDIDNVRLITSTKQFIDEYGEPELGQYFHYSALAYLSRGNALYCLRVQKSSLYGGVSIAEDGGTNYAFVVGRSSRAYADDSNYPNALFYITAKDPGVWNNNLAVTITNVDATAYTFDINVFEKDEDGNYVSQESWTVSRKVKNDGYGRQLYLEDRINGFSSYIAVADNTDVADTTLPKAQATALDFAGGTNGVAVTDSEVITGWEAFENKNTYPVRTLINSGYTSTAVQGAIKDVAELRRDCFAVLDVPEAQLTSVNSQISWRNNTQNFNTSYAALYSGWVKFYDQYNDVTVTLPPSGFIAAMYAYNDYVSNTWYAPAGFQRGLLDVLGVTNKYSEADMDSLYPAQINPIMMASGEGFVVMGQKTLQKAASALDRVNVRRFMNMIETATQSMLNSFLFEPNTTSTRFRVSAVLDEYYSKLAAAGAFQTEGGDKGYLIVCDESNNTASTIDANQLNVDVFVKPARSAEYIQVNVVLTRTGASFNEIISRNVIL